MPVEPNPSSETEALRVVLFGTYDLGKPRVRIMRRGLQAGSCKLFECHQEVWSGIEDKTQIKGVLPKLAVALRWLFAYPQLIWRYLRTPAHDVVLVGYMGLLDIFVLWPLAKVRGVPIAWDVFFSLYETVVEDRRFLHPKNPLAWILYALEFVALRLCFLVFMDTDVHGKDLARRFQLPSKRVASFWVGVEQLFCETDDSAPLPTRPLRVLFYGQFIPLHGIETIVRAAAQCEDENIEWTLVGRGQAYPQMRALADSLGATRIRWVDWVPYRELPPEIRAHHIGLGIFGDSPKARAVIPNKVFQILAAGRPLISAAHPALLELGNLGESVQLIASPDPKALLEAIQAWKSAPPIEAATNLREKLLPCFRDEAIGDVLLTHLQQLKGQGFSS